MLTPTVMGSMIQSMTAVGLMEHRASIKTVARTAMAMERQTSTINGQQTIQISKTNLRFHQIRTIWMLIIRLMASSLRLHQRTVSYGFGTLRPMSTFAPYLRTRTTAKLRLYPIRRTGCTSQQDLMTIPWTSTIPVTSHRFTAQ